MNPTDELTRNYYTYLALCKAHDKEPLPMNDWINARLNAMQDTIDTMLTVWLEQTGDGR